MAPDEAYIAKADFDAFQAPTVPTKKRIAGFMHDLKQTPFKGTRYH